MKKSLLFVFALCGAMAANAMEPLTAEQLSNLTVNVSNHTDGSFCLSSKVSLEYADASNPSTLLIQNFIGSGLPLRLNVNWEAGTVSAAPYVFAYEENYDDGTVYNLMVVSEAASNLPSPSDPAFNSSKVNGTISETALTLDPWNIAVVSQYFTSMTKKYDKAITTKIVASNATMTLQLREANWEKKDPDTYICPIEDTELLQFGTYVEDHDTELLVYNWNDMASCVKLYKSKVDGKYVFSTNADDIIFVRNKRYQYGIYPFDGQTDEFLYDIEAAPLVSEPVTAANEINFGYWIIYALSRKSEGSMGRYAKLHLDFNLNLDTDGISDSLTDEAPVKVTYYNLYGIEVANPKNGVFVKASTYPNGKTTTTKVVLNK